MLPLGTPLALQAMGQKPVRYAAGLSPPSCPSHALRHAGERHITPWLQLIGRAAPATPYVEVTLVRSGDALRSVGAAVYKLTPEDEADHATLVQEFRNASHWPKHLLVSYTWVARHEVDAQRGLLVLFGAGAAVAALAVLSAARAHRQKLRQFLADVTRESVGGAAAPLGKAD